MNIGNKTIRTPGEDPIGYSLSWRWEAAQAALELAVGGGRVPWIKDADVRPLIQHLQRRQKHPIKDGEKPTTLDTVLGWKESPAAGLIEAFIIAGPTIEDAARELGLPAEEMGLYARLYLDLYDSQGRRRGAVSMRILNDLAIQDEGDPGVRLKKIALTGGLHGLRRVLHTDVPTTEPSLDQLVEAELKRRLVAGELRAGDLVRLQANAIARERIVLDRKDDEPSEHTQGLDLVRSILVKMAPTVVQPDGSLDQVEASNQAIRSRLAAQRNIGATPLPDDNPDRGLAALNGLMAAQFKRGDG